MNFVYNSIFVSFIHSSHALSLSIYQFRFTFHLSFHHHNHIPIPMVRLFVSLLCFHTYQWIQYDCCRFIFSTLFVVCSLHIACSCCHRRNRRCRRRRRLCCCLFPFYSLYLCSVVMSLLPLSWSSSPL